MKFTIAALLGLVTTSAARCADGSEGMCNYTSFNSKDTHLCFDGDRDRSSVDPEGGCPDHMKKLCSIGKGAYYP